MNQKVRVMLENMYDVFYRRFGDPIESWDRFVEFLAVDNCGQLIYQIDHKFEWLFEDMKLAKEIMDSYDSRLLRSDYYDHLGEIFLEKIVNKNQTMSKRFCLTPMSQAEELVRSSLDQSNKRPMILDPAVGSGRVLMAAYRLSPEAELFGVNDNMRVLRIAFTNFFIHDIHGFLLHADISEHETDITTEEGCHNWQFANLWNSQIDRLKQYKSGSQRALQL